MQPFKFGRREVLFFSEGKVFLFRYQSGKKINSNPNPLVLLSVGHKAQESKVSSYSLYL